MSYLLDTDRLIDHLANDMEVQHLLMRLARQGIAMSAVSYMELYQGVIEAPDRRESERRLAVLLASNPVLPFTQEIAEICAGIRAVLKRAGRRVRPRVPDLMIAATALAHDLTVVTGNGHDYEDIPGLRLYEPEQV